MVLDTNIYSGLVDGDQSVIDALSRDTTLVIPLPVLAELNYGFLKGSRTDYNRQNLQRFLAQPQVSIISPSLKTTDYYAEIQLYSRMKGKALSNNDIWIAALAQEISETLVTFDKDFSVLSDYFGDKIVILDH